MTPSERADNLVDAGEFWVDCEHMSDSKLKELIAAAITAAVAEERERCAKIAESKVNHKGKPVPYSREIAAEIRSGIRAIEEQPNGSVQ